MTIQANWDDTACLWDDPNYDWQGNYVGPTAGPVPFNFTPINQGGTFYLRILLQSLFTQGNRTVRDINGNYYPIANILYSNNNSLLNSIVYYEPNSKRITYTGSWDTIPLKYINQFVLESPSGLLSMSVPPAPSGGLSPSPQQVDGTVAPYLYDVVSPV